MSNYCHSATVAFFLLAITNSLPWTYFLFFFAASCAFFVSSIEEAERKKLLDKIEGLERRIEYLENKTSFKC